MVKTDIDAVIQALKELGGEATVPKNVKAKIEKIIGILQEDSDFSIRVNKALHELDEINDDTNMQAFTRTQLWNIASMLETV